MKEKKIALLEKKKTLQYTKPHGFLQVNSYTFIRLYSGQKSLLWYVYIYSIAGHQLADPSMHSDPTRYFSKLNQVLEKVL